MKPTTIPPHLRWQCRRGMLELDVLLGKFLETAYLQLSAADQALFEKLLACNDQDLFMWLTGKETPANSDLLGIVNQVRAHARAKN